MLFNSCSSKLDRAEMSEARRKKEDCYGCCEGNEGMGMLCNSCIIVYSTSGDNKLCEKSNLVSAEVEYSIVWWMSDRRGIVWNE